MKINDKQFVFSFFNGKKKESSLHEHNKSPNVLRNVLLKK